MDRVLHLKTRKPEVSFNLIQYSTRNRTYREQKVERGGSKHWLPVRPFSLRSKIIIFAEFDCLVHKSLTTALTQGEGISTDYKYQDTVITWDHFTHLVQLGSGWAQSPGDQSALFSSSQEKKKCICKHMCVHMCTHVYMHSHILYVCKHICMHIYLYVYELYIHTYAYICVYLYTVMWVYGCNFLIEHILKKQQIKAWM